MHCQEDGWLPGQPQSADLFLIRERNRPLLLSSSRSDCGERSVNVRGRPPLSTVVVTQLVTRPGLDVLAAHTAPEAVGGQPRELPKRVSDHSRGPHLDHEA
jgi:hypothetical protein